MSLSKKLKTLLLAQNLSLSGLSKNSGVPIPTIHRMVKGKTKHPNEKALDAISAYFGISTYDLTKQENVNGTEDNNVSSFKVPVIEWDKLDIFFDESINYENDKRVIATNVSNNSFALLMPDNSMDPMMKKDSILIFDPLVKIVDRCYGLVKLYDADTYVVRQILVDVNKYFIKSLYSDDSERPLKKLADTDRIVAKLVEIRTQL